MDENEQKHHLLNFMLSHRSVGVGWRIYELEDAFQGAYTIEHITDLCNQMVADGALVGAPNKDGMAVITGQNTKTALASRKYLKRSNSYMERSEPPQLPIRNVHKVRIKKAIGDSGYDPFLFDCVDIHQGYRISFNGDIHFLFNVHAEDYNQFVYSFTKYSPSRETKTFHTKHIVFDEVIEQFRDWLNTDIKLAYEDLTVEDTWPTKSGNAGEYSDSFTVDERIELLERLDNVPDQFAAWLTQDERISNLLRENLKPLENGINEIKEKIGTGAGRKEIKQQFMGMILEWAVQAGLSFIAGRLINLAVGYVAGIDLTMLPPTPPNPH